MKKKYTPGVLTQTITEYEEHEENWLFSFDMRFYLVGNDIYYWFLIYSNNDL
jgi:hypothetical protein